MRLRAVLVARPAARQLDDILQESEESFGPAARERYESQVLQALEDLLDHPARPGVRQVAGCLHYHLRHSRARVPKEQGLAAFKPRKRDNGLANQPPGIERCTGNT